MADAHGDAVARLAGDLSSREVNLVRCAYRVIGSKGVHRLSLQDIADVAGVSKGVILYHFKTKENLILLTMRWVLSRVAERINASLEDAATPHDKVLAMIDAIFIDADANRNFYVAYLDLVDEAARSDAFADTSETFQSIVDSLYADVIRKGVDAGAFAVDDVAEAASIVRAIIDGLFVQWLPTDDWRSRHAAYRETCKRAVLAYLRSAVPVSS